MPQRILTIDEVTDLVGQEIASSEWFEVTQSRIDQFAELTNDRQWIHVDTERAKEEMPNGTTIAHGFLTLSLLSYLVGQAVFIEGDFHRRINYGFNRLRFVSPVPAGSRIRARLTLGALEEVRNDGLQVTWNVTVEVEGVEKPALVAEWLGRMY
jgi:acyl dehydratase